MGILANSFPALRVVCKFFSVHCIFKKRERQEYLSFKASHLIIFSNYNFSNSIKRFARIIFFFLFSSHWQKILHTFVLYVSKAATFYKQFCENQNLSYEVFVYLLVCSDHLFFFAVSYSSLVTACYLMVRFYLFIFVYLFLIN